MKKGIVDLLLKTGKLKNIKRAGWVREKFPDPESVAEHTFRVCFLALILAEDLKLERSRLLEMALLHDIEEFSTFDPVTQRGSENVANHDHVLEKKVVRELFSPLKKADEYYKIWEEHIPQSNPGAPRISSILYQIGKIATAWQALEYELARENPKKLDEWWKNAKVYVKEPLLVELLKALEKRRQK